jgi:hypothetical protein
MPHWGYPLSYATVVDVLFSVGSTRAVARFQCEVKDLVLIVGASSY